MKAKKILSLVLALCMVLSVLSAGFVVANAAETEKTGGDKLAADLDTNANTNVGDGENATAWITGSSYRQKTLSEEEANTYKELLIKNYADSADYNFFPLTIIGSQAADGGNIKALLCFTTVSDSKRAADTAGKNEEELNKYALTSSWYFIFSFYESSTGKKTLLDGAVINPADIKILDKNTENANSPWVIKSTEGVFPDDKVIAAMNAYTELDLQFIASIADEIDTTLEKTGNYKYLCYGSANNKTNLYVVSVHVGDDAAEITDVAIFDLNKNTTTDTSKVTKDTNTDPTKTANDEKKDDNVNKDTSSKSPKTGSNDFASAFAILFFVSCFAGISAYKLAKKRG